MPATTVLPLPVAPCWPVHWLRPPRYCGGCRPRDRLPSSGYRQAGFRWRLSSNGSTGRHGSGWHPSRASGTMRIQPDAAWPEPAGIAPRTGRWSGFAGCAVPSGDPVQGHEKPATIVRADIRRPVWRFSTSCLPCRPSGRRCRGGHSPGRRYNRPKERRPARAEARALRFSAGTGVFSTRACGMANR